MNLFLFFLTSKQILKKAPEEAVTKAPAVKEEPVSAPAVPAVQPPVASSSTAHPPAASGAPSASGMSYIIV